MPFHLNNEQQMIQLMAREFARRELEPVAGRLDREGTSEVQGMVIARHVLKGG